MSTNKQLVFLLEQALDFLENPNKPKRETLVAVGKLTAKQGIKGIQNNEHRRYSIRERRPVHLSNGNLRW